MHPTHCLWGVFQVIALVEKRSTYFVHFMVSKEWGLLKSPRNPRKSHQGWEGESASAVVILCFVEFDNPKCAPIAMEALQGYKFDENDRDSPSLKLQVDRERSRSSYGDDREYYRHRRWFFEWDNRFCWSANALPMIVRFQSLTYELHFHFIFRDCSQPWRVSFNCEKTSNLKWEQFALFKVMGSSMEGISVKCTHIVDLVGGGNQLLCDYRWDLGY